MIVDHTNFASVESRTIDLGTDVANLHITTAHLSEGGNATSLLSEFVSSEGFVVPLALFGEAFNHLVLDPCEEGGRFNVREINDTTIGLLMAPLLASPSATLIAHYSSESDSLFRRLRDDLGHRSAIAKLDFIARQAMALKVVLTKREFLFQLTTWQTLANYEIPFAHSPELGAIPLSKLLGAGAKSACLVPLLTGIHGAVQAQMTNSYAVAFESALAGGGITLITLSSLWIADKLLRGVRSQTCGVSSRDKDTLLNARLECEGERLKEMAGQNRAVSPPVQDASEAIGTMPPEPAVEIQESISKRVSR